MQTERMVDIMDKTKSSKKGFYTKTGVVAVGLLISIMVIISIWKFGTIFFLFPVWRWMAYKMTDTTGMDIWLARGISALLVIPFVYIISMVFSWKKNRRHAGIALLAVTSAIICFGMFYISQDTYFSFKTGEAMKYYIVTPQGDYKFSSSPGYDTVWGGKYKKVTPKVVEEYMSKVKGVNRKDDAWIGVMLLIATLGLVGFGIGGFVTSASPGGSTSIPKESKKKTKPSQKSLLLSREEEQILVNALGKPIRTAGDAWSVFDAMKALAASPRDYSREICDVLTREPFDTERTFRGSKKKLYNNSLLNGINIVWTAEDRFSHLSRIVDAIMVVDLLRKYGSKVAIPALVEIYGNAGSGDLRTAAKNAITEIKERSS